MGIKEGIRGQEGGDTWVGRRGYGVRKEEIRG